MDNLWIKQELKKIKEMPIKKATGYIWDYYKIPLISIGVLLGLTCYFISIFLRPVQETAGAVAFINFYENVTEDSVFYTEFMKEYKEKMPKESMLVFDNHYFFNLEKEADYKNSYYQKLIAYLEAGTVDVVICEEENLMGIAKSGRFLDLSDERIVEIYKQYQERIVYLFLEGEKIPIGIDISDSSVLTGLNGYQKKCYLAISSNVLHLEFVESFLQYLLK